jgi:hypothetical protein
LTGFGVSAVSVHRLISPVPIPTASVPAALTLATSPGYVGAMVEHAGEIDDEALQGRAVARSDPS